MKHNQILLIAITLISSQAIFAGSPEASTQMNSVSVHQSEVTDQPFWSAGQEQQAELEKKYQQAIESNPENKINYTYLAGLYLTNNKTGKAIDAYQEAITQDPENAKLFAAISIAYLHQARYGMAKAMANEALRLDPEMAQVAKINEYIIAKQEAIEAASKVSEEEVNAGRSQFTSSMPTDATHGKQPHGSSLLPDMLSN